MSFFTKLSETMRGHVPIGYVPKGHVSILRSLGNFNNIYYFNNTSNINNAT